MNQSKRSLINVMVLSSQKGCRIMSKLLQDNNFNIQFVDSVKGVKLNNDDFLIVDEI